MEVRSPPLSTVPARQIVLLCQARRSLADTAGLRARPGSGIGKACAVGLAKEGASGVMVADIDFEAAEAVAAACLAATPTEPDTKPGFRAEAVYVDVTVEASLRQALCRMIEVFGRIDYCVNSAGVRDCFLRD